MNEPQDDTFLRRTRAWLDAGEGDLDPTTRARLRAARREALAAHRRTPAWRQAWPVTAAGLAAAVLVAVLGVRLWTSPGDDLPPLEDMALLSDPAGPEFYQDLDFYLWLDEAEASTQEPTRG